MVEDNVSQKGSLPPPPMTQTYESEIVLHREPKVAREIIRSKPTNCLVKPVRLSFSTGNSWSISAPKPEPESTPEKSEEKKEVALPSFAGPQLQFPGMETRIKISGFDSRHLEFPDN